MRTPERWPERGIDRPRRATALNICREFGVNEEWLTAGTGPISKEEGMVAESPELYAHLKPGDRKLRKEFDNLLDSDDPEIINHLKRQIGLLTRLVDKGDKGRKK